MVPAAKAGLVVAAGAAGVAGSYFLITSSDTMPEYSTVAELDNGTEAYKDKIGKHYGHFLVNPNGSQGWWEWSYRRWQKDKGQSESFKTQAQVVSAFATSGSTSLNKACDNAYKKAETSAINFGAGTDDAHKLGADVLRYCSPLSGMPNNIAGDNYESNKWPNTKKENLVSTQGNDEFWKLQTKWFNDETSKPTNDKFFEQFLEDKGNNKKVLKGASIRDLCHRAYTAASTVTGNTEATAEKPKEAEIEKYCSFKKPISS